MATTLQCGDFSVAIESGDPRLLAPLTAVPLPEVEAAGPPEATVTLAPAEADQIEAAADALVAAGAREHSVGEGSEPTPMMRWLLSDEQTALHLPGLGLATIRPDWRAASIDLVPDQADTQPGWILLAIVLLDLVASHGYYAVHASMAERDGSAVLFCGERARGKTTSCLALGRAGWIVRADDRCFIRPQPAPLSVWGPAAEMRLCEDVAGLIEDLEPALERGTPWAGKKRVPLRELVSASGAAHCRPRLLLFPEVGAASHEHAPMAPAEALEELLLSTGVAALPAHAAAHFLAAAELVEQAPAYRLRLGRDLTALPAVVGRLLEGGRDG